MYGHGSFVDLVTWTVKNQFLFPQPQEAIYKIWIQLALWLLRRYFKLSYYEMPGSKVRE